MSRFSPPLFALICFFTGMLIAASPWMTWGGVVGLVLCVLEGSSPSTNAGEGDMAAFIFGGLSLFLGLIVMAVSAVSGMMLAVWMNAKSSNTRRVSRPQIKDSTDRSDS